VTEPGPTTINDPMNGILARAELLAHELAVEADDKSRLVAARLAGCVVRPLSAATTRGDVGPKPATPRDGRSDLAEQLFELAHAATVALSGQPDLTPLGEATAALQDLALGQLDDETAKDRIQAFVSLLAKTPARAQVVADGPYLVTNVPDVVDWLGCSTSAGPQVALCRCGRSQIKPICDGTHASVGFTDAKDPNRVSDRRDTYVGQQVTIYDNRGICQHSGLCTDRLATAFRVGKEPFVAPSGARMDELIRAARDCPSGALSIGIDGHEERAIVDWHGRRGPSVEVCKDGPYRVRGAVPLLDGHGADVVRNVGSSLEHYALCRCGRSQNKPFCSGMHWYVDFKDPVADDAGTVPTVFEWAGGFPALLRMTRLFYEKLVPEDPLLAPLFANMAADHPERVAKWLAEVFGGPRLYSDEHGGYPRMLSQHLGKQITEEHRARWVTLLARSAREAGLPNDAEFRSTFDAYIEWGTRLAVENSQLGARPPERMPMPHWDWNTAAGPPGSRLSAVRPPEEPVEKPVFVPAPGQKLSFDEHIKPLFRDRDRRSMSFAFDLWSEADVTQHAIDILTRLRAGTMPCDGRWPQERLDLLERWVNQRQ
jgi:CDGSH-type Zn-finger protein/truncated hemoglobin YjbI